MIHRIKEYQRTIFHPKDGLTTDLCQFTEEQVTAIGAVLEPDGLSIIDAIRLCQKWNNAVMSHPTRSGVLYSYSIPFVKKERTDA